MMPRRFTFALVAAIAALAAADAPAVMIDRTFSANAVSYCQTALPVFDGNVRKRPLAVQNEGTEDAFVTCAFTSQTTALTTVTVVAVNAGAVGASVTCTGVTGYNTGSNAYASKTIQVPASGWQGMQWTAADFSGGGNEIPGSGFFSISCRLPPGAGIGNSVIVFSEDIGA